MTNAGKAALLPCVTQNADPRVAAIRHSHKDLPNTCISRSSSGMRSHALALRSPKSRTILRTFATSRVSFCQRTFPTLIEIMSKKHILRLSVAVLPIVILAGCAGIEPQSEQGSTFDPTSISSVAVVAATQVPAGRQYLASVHEAAARYAAEKGYRVVERNQVGQDFEGSEPDESGTIQRNNAIEAGRTIGASHLLFVTIDSVYGLDSEGQRSEPNDTVRTVSVSYPVVSVGVQLLDASSETVLWAASGSSISTTINIAEAVTAAERSAFGRLPSFR